MSTPRQFIELEEACRAVCVLCYQGYPLTHGAPETHFEGVERLRCARPAAPLRKLKRWEPAGPTSDRGTFVVAPVEPTP